MPILQQNGTLQQLHDSAHQALTAKLDAEWERNLPWMTETVDGIDCRRKQLDDERAAIQLQLDKLGELVAAENIHGKTPESEADINKAKADAEESRKKLPGVLRQLEVLDEMTQGIDCLMSEMKSTEQAFHAELFKQVSSQPQVPPDSYALRFWRISLE